MGISFLFLAKVIHKWQAYKEACSIDHTILCL